MRFIKIALYLLLSGVAFGQVTQQPGVVIVSTDPTGLTCSGNPAGRLYAGTIYTCQSGAFAVYGGTSGGVTTFPASLFSVTGSTASYATGQTANRVFGTGPSGDVGLLSAIPAASPANSIQFNNGGLLGGNILVGAMLNSGGAYFSATPDANGGGPNQCPIWYWGDASCQSPSALMLNTNLAGDLSIYNEEVSGQQNLIQLTHTGTSLAPFAVGNHFELYTSALSTGPIGTIYGTFSNITAGGPSHIQSVYNFWGGFTPNNVSTLIDNYYGVYLSTAPISGSVTNFNQFYSTDLGPDPFANKYYSWFDSQGVRRVKEDNTFNAVGQAIEALYNPQFVKYTPGAANFERIILGQWNGNVAEIGTEAGGTGTPRVLRLIGPSASSAGPFTAPSLLSTGCTGLLKSDGTCATAPAGAIVGTTDTQALTGKTLDGVSPATMAFVDPTSSIQTQLNAKQATILSGTSGSIGGSALLAGQCSTGTATVTGATTSMAVAASPAGGVDPSNGGILGVAIDARVSASNTVTVSVCSPVAGTPTAATYNVRVF